MSSQTKNSNGVENSIANVVNELVIQYKTKSDKAIEEEIININTPLIVSIVAKYNKNDSDFDDLVQEGKIAIKKALKKFDLSKGVQFSTYVYLWIESSVKSYILSKCRTKRLTKTEITLSKKIAKCRNDLLLMNGQHPNDEEVVNYLSDNRIDIKKIRQIDYKTALFFSNDEEINSLNKKDILISTDYFEIKEDYESVKKVIDSKLTSIEKEVLNRKYGFEGFEPMTLKAIGDEFSYSKERIRQILASALYKLERHYTKDK